MLTYAVKSRNLATTGRTPYIYSRCSSTCLMYSALLKRRNFCPVWFSNCSFIETPPSCCMHSCAGNTSQDFYSCLQKNRRKAEGWCLSVWGMSRKVLGCTGEYLISTSCHPKSPTAPVFVSLSGCHWFSIYTIREI